MRESKCTWECSFLVEARIILKPFQGKEQESRSYILEEGRGRSISRQMGMIDLDCQISLIKQLMYHQVHSIKFIGYFLNLFTYLKTISFYYLFKIFSFYIPNPVHPSSICNAENIFQYFLALLCSLIYRHAIFSQIFISGSTVSYVDLASLPSLLS